MISRNSRLILTLCLALAVSSTAMAGTFSFLQKGKTGSVLNSLERGNMTRALMAWDQDYGQTSFGNSATGSALYSYIMIQSGFPVSGTERLLSLRNPSAVDQKLKNILYRTLPPHHWVWDIVSLKGKDKFSSIFPISYIKKAQIISAAGIRSAREANEIKAILRKVPDKNFKAMFQFPLMLWAYLNNKNALGNNLAESLIQADQRVVPMDRVYLGFGRGLYQQGRFEEAIRNYSRVAKDSDYWLEAIEEIAWAYAKIRLPHKSLAKLKTATSLVFAPAIGPEPFFLQTFLNLKLCDFKQVYKSIENFKVTFADRVSDIQSLAKTGRTDKSVAALNLYIRGRLDWRAVGPDLKYLPRMFFRDRGFVLSLKEAGQRRIEAKLAQKLYDSTIEDGVTLKNLEREMDQLIRKASLYGERATGRALRRLRVLAQRDIKEMNAMLQKLHLVEAETIQRLYSHQLESRPVKGKFDHAKPTSDDLVFPANDEVWLDELDHYQVNVQSCPTAKEVQR